VGAATLDVKRESGGAIIRAMLAANVRAMLVGLSLATGAVAPASAGAPTMPLTELKRWFESIPNAGIVMAQPHDWQYTFVASNGHALEALSHALVRDGYRIVALEGGATPVLRMAKAELHSPLTLARRNEALGKTARTYGATYDSWGVTL
jgi:hypothetical protein